MTPDPQPAPILPWILGLVGVIIFGITLPVTKLALNEFSPGFITLGRAVIGGLAAITFMLATGKKFKNPHNLTIFLGGSMLIYGFPGFMALGLTTVDAYHGGVVLGFLPLLTATVSALIAAERHSPLFWGLGISGAIITAGYAWYSGSGGGGQSGSGFSIGDFWLFMAACCTAIGYVISGKVARLMPGWEVICRALMLHLPIVLAGTVYFYEPQFISASAVSWVSIIYLGLFSMFLGFFAWNTALAKGGIGRIGQLQLLQTFVTLFASALLLGEQVDGIAIATCCIIAAIIYAARKA